MYRITDALYLPGSFVNMIKYLYCNILILTAGNSVVGMASHCALDGAGKICQKHTEW